MNENEITVFMNTWANYNENGADDGITPTGWMSVDEALDYCEEYAEYEPFINDVDNPLGVDLGISEYGNVIEDLENIQRINDIPEYDRDALIAILEDQGGSINDALEIWEDGDYEFYPNISDYTDLAYEIIEGIGGIGEALGDRANYYIDEDSM